jgi:hypothetical protein
VHANFSSKFEDERASLFLSFTSLVVRLVSLFWRSRALHHALQPADRSPRIAVLQKLFTLAKMGFAAFTSPAALQALEAHLTHVSYIEG